MTAYDGQRVGKGFEKRLGQLIAQGGGVAHDTAGGRRYAPRGARGGLSEAEVRDAVARDLLVRTGPDAVAATEAGVAWRRRQEARDTPFREQHGALRRPGNGEGPAVDLAESPLAWLHRRRDRDGRPMIGDAAFAAGERLRADFTLGNMTPRMSIRWDGQPSSGGGGGGAGELTDTALAARQRLRRAVDAVGPELSGVLIDVCCFLKGMEEVERDRHWPARSAKTILGLALARLARHYGLGDEAIGTRRAGRIEGSRVRQAGVEGRAL